MTSSPEPEFLEPPAGKDIDAQMVVDLRRMLSRAGYGRPDDRGDDLAEGPEG